VDLLEWVIEHHVEANVLREIDPIFVINTISKLLVLYTEEEGGSYV